jgi:uncharacterized membrane protein YciS (DUF1049 family)
MKNVLRLILVLVVVVALTVLIGCQREAKQVSHNLSLEADNFNITRQLTVVNTRAEDGNTAILFQMTGNFSIEKELDGDLAVVGENPGGTYYKHFVCLSRDITYIVEDLGTTHVNKHKFEINFNLKMIVPVQPVIID